MSQESGLYSVATDGTSIFVSNTYRNSICKISPDGTIEPNYIIVTAPISIEIRVNILFVQTVSLIHLYDISDPYQATNDDSLLFESSDQYPSMAYNRNDNLLYISNYTKGTITTMDASGVFRTLVRNVVGISGICFAYKMVFFSNEIRNTVSLYTNNTIQECLRIPSPRGLCFFQNELYICYGTTSQYGIAVNKLYTNNYTTLFNSYANRTIPLTVTFLGSNIYYTADKRNEIYVNEKRYAVIDYKDISVNPNTGITQSVVIKNTNCLFNNAFIGLINLRTIGSNQNNPIIPVTTLVGRSQGSQIKMDPGVGMSYEDLKMRRKAEILKYKNLENTPFTKKQTLSNIVNAGGSYYYSKAKLAQLAREEECKNGINKGIPLEKTKPTNSGIIDPLFEGYYLNTNIPYYASL